MGLLDETLVTLQEAADSFPGRGAGRRMSFSTVWRWALRGILTSDGRRVKLEAQRVGGRWLTSKEAIQRFSIALTLRIDTDEPKPILKTNARQRGGDTTKKKLEKLGI